jgi:hypothetical protein
MGLIGVIVAGLVNIFLASSMMQFIISVASVIIFTGLTAWDTQRLKDTYGETYGTEMQDKVALMGALSLYLNFVNGALSSPPPPRRSTAHLRMMPGLGEVWFGRWGDGHLLNDAHIRRIQTRAAEVSRLGCLGPPPSLVRSCRGCTCLDWLDGACLTWHLQGHLQGR